MKSYPDTSLIVSAFTQEVGTGLADRWLGSIKEHELLFSAWCLTEVSSALAGKVRAGALTSAEAARLSSAIPNMLRDSGTLTTIQQRHFRSASALLERCPAPLKASDALHLAIADDIGARLWTLDRRMAEAGEALGLDVELLG